MKFDELTKCPFCGSEEFYTRNYMYGSSCYHQRFDGGEAYDNSQMYDGLSITEGVKCFCSECGKYLGNKTTGKLSNAAIAKIEKEL